MSTSTPATLFTFAESYLQAAIRLEAHQGTPLPSKAPLSFLLAHALELTLKAYLLHKNYPEDRLKNIGHNLEKLAKTCKRAGLPHQTTVDEEKNLAYLSGQHQNHQTRYADAGGTEQPDHKMMIEMIQRIRHTISEDLNTPEKKV
ncbi:MAG: hypothetical protein COY40_04330 [Alphaproteobacteria bacterium CG_4_10_14_0_8_um_filter_53_9]|nr:MAG: hypothetical protein COY40_04330 [Alphaproteobacteria bacterium CG_4_10_14_0_8_um_filter_53_9]